MHSSIGIAEYAVRLPSCRLMIMTVAPRRPDLMDSSHVRGDVVGNYEERN